MEYAFGILLFVSEENLFDRIFVRFDHLLDHLATDRTGLSGGQVAIVALLQVNANLVGSFHFEFLHSGFRLGNNDFVVAGHSVTLLWFSISNFCCVCAIIIVSAAKKIPANFLKKNLFQNVNFAAENKYGRSA